jgi:hypothetical protein
VGLYGNDDDKLITKILNQAVAAGLDPVQALHGSGLLLTESRLMQLRTEALEQVIQLMRDVPAHQLLGQGRGNLAEDYRKALLEMLDELASKARTKWFT